jgi:ecotropic viral integration site 5 protein
MFSEREQRIWSLQRRGNRLKLFGLTDATQIAGMTIRFIDEDSTLVKLLAVCRDFNEVLRDEFLKQALLRSS